MAITHVVMFSFAPLATDEEVDGVCKRMLALKDKCIHPTTNKPYIRSATGGKQNSPEGLSNGVTHVFVSEFENEADRKYYLEQDPDHQEFMAGNSGIVAKAQVVDFTHGAF